MTAQEESRPPNIVDPRRATMHPPLTYDIANELLQRQTVNPFSGEQNHRWSGRLREFVPPAFRHPLCNAVVDQLWWDGILMRTHDTFSGSQPDSKTRMQARAARMRLDTDEIRKQTLTKHIDHGNREDTPYISFTNSPSSLEELANKRLREGRRGDQNLVVVDPRVRFELGLPILRYSEEIDFYKLKTKYAVDYSSQHYLCLWEVTPGEVVGTWRWDDLRNQPDWFNKTIRPAVELHRMLRDHKKEWDAKDRRDSLLAEDVRSGPLNAREREPDNPNGVVQQDADGNGTDELSKMCGDLKIS